MGVDSTQRMVALALYNGDFPKVEGVDADEGFVADRSLVIDVISDSLSRYTVIAV